MASERNWTHRSKHTPWIAGESFGPIIKVGKDWSAAGFVMAFAVTEAGSPVITLTSASAGSQGVSAVYDADYVHPATGEVVGATIISPHIDETTFEALTFTGTEPLVLHYDFLVTPAGESQRPELFGTLTVHQGIGD